MIVFWGVFINLVEDLGRYRNPVLQLIRYAHNDPLPGYVSSPIGFGYDTWWRHQMETFSALLAICAGNSPATGEFPTQRPVTRSFDVFFDLSFNKRLSKQLRDWWFETLSHPLWRHCDDFHWWLTGVCCPLILFLFIRKSPGCSIYQAFLWFLFVIMKSSFIWSLLQARLNTSPNEHF